jgi:lysozyme family protein
MPSELITPKFSVSFAKTQAREGYLLLTDDPNDKGKETYSGISRAFNPFWSGWVIIDACRQREDFPECLCSSELLTQMVAGFYRHNYWDVNRLDSMGAQEIADEMFDSGVNCGAGMVAQWLQRSLNLLNLRATRWPDLVVDGEIGGLTITALQAFLAKFKPLHLVNLLNGYQVSHYIQITAADQIDEVYLIGWMERVTITH